MEGKKNDKTLAAAIILFWALAGAYYIGQRYIKIETADSGGGGVRLITVTPDMPNKKVFDDSVLEDPVFRSLTQGAAPAVQNKTGGGNRDPFKVSEKTR